MCLAVYLGSNLPLDPSPSIEGDLALELASWRPEPLKHCRHVYYLGRQGRAQVECSCLLSENIDWTDGTPKIVADDLMDAAPNDPKSTLKAWCDALLSQGGHVWLVCDDAGGVECGLQASDYESSSIESAAIRRGELLFEDSDGNWDCKVMEVTKYEPETHHV